MWRQIQGFKEVCNTRFKTSFFDQAIFGCIGQDALTFNPEVGALNGTRERNMNSKSKSSPALQVVLGSQTIKAFVAAPKEFKVMGIVRMGMEFGLLATTASGTYVRVNGSTVKALSTDAVEEAIRVARQSGRGESYAASRSHSAAGTAQANPAQASTPAVIVRKRRRHVQLPEFRPQPAVNLSVQVEAA